MYFHYFTMRQQYSAAFYVKNIVKTKLFKLHLPFLLFDFLTLIFSDIVEKGTKIGVNYLRSRCEA